MKLLDYIQGLRKGKEAHRLEKESMKDPFLADAMDGYHQVEGNHAEQIRKLQMKVSAQAGKKKNLYAIGWSVAACLIIGVGISSYFLMMKNSIGEEEVLIAKENVPPMVDEPEKTATIPDKTVTVPNKTSPVPDRTAQALQASKPMPKSKTRSTTPSEITPVGATPIKETLAEETDTSSNDINRKQILLVSRTAQTGNAIKGKVVDEQGNPIIGANVTYKEAHLGTVTNLDGEFSLPKREGEDEIIVSFIGFENAVIPVDTNQTMLIAMNSSDSNLNEAVVTGNGIPKKIKVTGAITSISPEELKVDKNRSNTYAGALKKVKKSGMKPGKELPASKPVIGMKQYKKYLKKNMIRPVDEDCARTKGKVTLSFFIDRNRRPYKIEVKESLCESLDKEAIRLIEEGPDWTYSNKPVEIKVKF